MVWLYKYMNHFWNHSKYLLSLYFQGEKKINKRWTRLLRWFVFYCRLQYSNLYLVDTVFLKVFLLKTYFIPSDLKLVTILLLETHVEWIGITPQVA